MKLYKITLLLASMMLLTGVTSCSDDDVKQTPLETTEGLLDNSSFNTLSFQWDKVAGATQYSYQLSDANGHVVATDVTNVPEATITDLEPSTDYTLTVLAYAAPYGDKATSEPLVLHGRTSDIIVMATPQVTYERLANNLTFTWDAIEGADGYTYTFSKDDAELRYGTITDTSIKFSDLDTGTYTFEVTADIDKPGYASSAVASVEVDFEWVDPVEWTVVGTYTSEKLGQSWPATLVAYIDGTYSLKAWYNVQGYDLDFSLDTSTPDDMFVLADGYEYEGYYPKLFTGRTSAPTYVYLYPWDNECWLSVEDGEMGLYMYTSNTWYTDSFKWDTDQEGTDIDLSGTWSMTTSATSRLENSSYSPEQLDETVTCEVTKIDANTYKFPALYFSIWDDEEAEEDKSYMTVSVDAANKTLTVAPTSGLWYYYTLSGSASASESIVGKINDDGSLTFTNWSCWYGKTAYVYDGTVTFTRK